MLFLLFGFWLLMNGKVTLEIALVGAALSALIYVFLIAFVGYSPKKEWAYAKKIPKFCGYFVFLISEIFKSTFAVIRFVWSPKTVTEPQLVSFDPKLQSEAGRVVLADSITLTPGTVTVAVREGKFLVHALDNSMAEGLDDNDMTRRVRALEGGGQND